MPHKGLQNFVKMEKSFFKENSNPKSHCPTCVNIALNVTKKAKRARRRVLLLDSTTVLIFLHIEEGEQPVKEGGNFLS